MEPEFASEDFLSCSLGGGGRYFSVPSTDCLKNASEIITRERSQKFKLMKFGNFGSETCGGLPLNRASLCN